MRFETSTQTIKTETSDYATAGVPYQSQHI